MLSVSLVKLAFYQVAIKASQNEPLTSAEEILAQNFAHQTVWIFENDFIQYKAGLMDEDVWKAKLFQYAGS